MTEIQKDLDDFIWSNTLREHLKFFESLYHRDVAAKRFESADLDKEIIQRLQKELKENQDAIIAINSRGSVSAPHHGSDKTVFILKR